MRGWVDQCRDWADTIEALIPDLLLCPERFVEADVKESFPRAETEMKRILDGVAGKIYASKKKRPGEEDGEPNAKQPKKRGKKTTS